MKKAPALAVPLCARCQREMIQRTGKFGLFWACQDSTKAHPHPTRSVDDPYRGEHGDDTNYSESDDWYQAEALGLHDMD